MDIGDRAQIRKRAGLTQIKLAKLTGISQTRLCFWENEELELSYGDVERIAQILKENLVRLHVFRVPQKLCAPLALPKLRR
jgi:transcriptional regulator with XRE-family HTH domain